jgi:hypothetical protein
MNEFHFRPFFGIFDIICRHYYQTQPEMIRKNASFDESTQLSKFHQFIEEVCCKLLLLARK